MPGIADPLARRRALIGFCLYDFANSAYTTLIITLVFSVYFREAVVHAGDNSGDFLWGLANFMAMVLVAATSPILGAVADYSGRRKRLLVLFTLQAVLAAALLFTVAPGHIAWGMFLYIVGTVGFEAGYVFYNAFLSDLAAPEAAGRVSGWAWAAGYAGGLASLALCYPLIDSELHDGLGRLSAAAIHERQLSFLLVAAFYLVFALPAFLWLRESRPQGTPLSLKGYTLVGLRRVAATLGQLRRHRETAKFIAASFFFTDGISTVITFSAIYATSTFGFTSAEMRNLFLVLNLVALPAALAAGYAADILGPKRTLSFTLVLWIGVVLTAFLAQSKAAFWIMASGAAVGMGSTQAVGRSFMSQLSPKARSAEFFGFYVLSGKLGSMFGPLLFGVVSSASGSQRLAVLSLLPLFVAGLVLLLRVDEQRGLQLAAESPPS